MGLFLFLGVAPNAATVYGRSTDQEESTMNREQHAEEMIAAFEAFEDEEEDE